jgi:protein required for attachment to host cells
MSSDLILIANAAEARLLIRCDPAAGLALLDTLRYQPRPPGAPQPPGPLSKAAPDPRMDYAWASPPNPRRRHWRAFATVVARRFETALSEQPVDRAVLFAACPFLGELMRQLSPATKKRLLAVVDADVADLPEAELQQRIEQELQAAERTCQELARVTATDVRA